MFGQQNDKPDENKIPEHSIDGALNDNHHSPAPASPSFPHPGTPLDDTSPPVSDGPPPEVIAPDEAPHPHPEPSAPTDSVAAHDLIDIKQKALGELTPLVGHLDQSPEDKFRTTMMMIQASDDQNLVQTAYDAAQKIEDEKTRAQALLDIVNEINYFTQHHDQ
jgi:hypothetical protein